MSDVLEPLDLGKPCPKCGYQYNGIENINGATVVMDTLPTVEFHQGHDSSPYCPVPREKQGRNHLKVTCWRCEFSWATLTRDKE